MAKQNRRLRVGIPLDPEVHDTLDRMCEVTGKSKSSICEEIISEAMPAVEQMMIAMQKLKVSKQGGMREMAEYMEKLAFEAKQMGLELGKEADKK